MHSHTRTHAHTHTHTHTHAHTRTHITSTHVYTQKPGAAVDGALQCTGFAGQMKREVEGVEVTKCGQGNLPDCLLGHLRERF